MVKCISRSDILTKFNPKPIMKLIKILFAALLLLAASCSNESIEQSVEQAIEQATAPVTV